MSKSKNVKAKQLEVSAETRSHSIAEDVAAFLSAGGTINKIPNGVSGQTYTSGPKHISLGNNKQKA